MAKGEIIIDDKLCKGCGLCAEFCSRNCITLPQDRLSARGLTIAVFSQPEECNGCGVCGWMCPDYAIEVFKYTKAAT